MRACALKEKKQKEPCLFELRLKAGRPHLRHASCWVTVPTRIRFETPASPTRPSKTRRRLILLPWGLGRQGGVKVSATCFAVFSENGGGRAGGGGAVCVEFLRKTKDKKSKGRLGARKTRRGYIQSAIFGGRKVGGRLSALKKRQA